jgi:hypothetical protein
MGPYCDRQHHLDSRTAPGRTAAHKTAEKRGVADLGCMQAPVLAVCKSAMAGAVADLWLAVADKIVCA